MLLAEQWVSLVCGSDGYPRPLELEVEERATSYEFLELIVSSVGKVLKVEFHSKFDTADGTSASVYYSRYPNGGDAMAMEERTQYVAGHLHRIVDGTMFEDTMETAVVLLSREVVAANWPLQTVRCAIFKVLNGIRKVWCEKVLREVLGTLNWMMGGF
jgi:hypothetical protein|tara:strand:+ start:637 stop:1110 length:474 start_codon:yes stop_codon:yes gene_type:complete